jgi:integrase
MAALKVRRLVQRNGSYYFQANAAMRKAGIHSEALGAVLHTAVARAEELNAEWDAIRKGEDFVSGVITIDRLITMYEQSSWYRELAPKTILEVDQATALIRSAFGKYPVKALRRPHILEFHDKLYNARSLPLANKAVRWLRRVLQFAVDREIRPDNPALRLRLAHLPPRQQRWTPEQVQAVIDKAIEMELHGWARGIAIAYDTSQRLSDVLSATWAHYDGEGITFHQAKVARKKPVEIWVSLWPDTIQMLAGVNRTAVTIVTGERGRPITQQAYFGRRFREICRAAGVSDDLQFRDLRRTAATEVSAGGGRVESLTGHVEGSPMAKVYVMKTKEAARSAQAARQRIRNKK